MTLTCGGSNRGYSASLMLAAVVEPPPTAAVVLEVAAADRSFPVTCPAGERLCLVEAPEVAAIGSAGNFFTSQVSWSVGGRTSRATCRSDASFVLPQPEGSAEVVAGRLRVTWSVVPGAVKYAATFRDLDLRPPELRQPRVLGRLVTTETQAEFDLPDGLPEVAVVDLEAWALDPDTFTGDAVPAGGANRSVRPIPVIGAPWALKQPADLAAGALALPLPAGTRMAVILLNLAGTDGAVATVRATGTSPADPARASVRREPEARPRRPAGVAVAARGPATSPARRTFCTFEAPFELLFEFTGSWSPVRRPATLLLETADALLYVDDEDVAGFTSAGLEELARWWDDALASVTSHSGPLPDVDGNGKFILLFTSVLGPGVPCFASEDDVWSPLDTSAGCKAGTSNAADMIHLHPPSGLQDGLGHPLSAEDQWAVVKGAVPYALQRIVDSGRLGYDYQSDPGFAYARMALARTLAGSGAHLAGLRALVGPLAFTRAGLGQGGYSTVGLFPYGAGGNGGARRAALELHVQFLADRLGPGFVQRFFDRAVGPLTFENVSEVPFPIAYALWTGALVFSNEPASPWRGFDYLGEGWTPLHEKYQRFEYAPLEAGDPVTVELRRNGFDVLVTGVAAPGGGTVTVTSGEAAKPYVVAIPFRGELP